MGKAISEAKTPDRLLDVTLRDRSQATLVDWGVIVLGGRQPGQFDLNDLNLACGVARQTAQAILNARHREEEHARARHGRQFVRF